MSLLTRENPETTELEVFVNDEWVSFNTYRTQQIDEAYDKSVKFLRERLGEDYAQREQELLAQKEQ